MLKGRERRVRLAQGGRLDRIETMRPFTESWWGRVGEELFLALYPDAKDAVLECGNRAPFDATHRTLGRVNVKTAKEVVTKFGVSRWVFQLEGSVSADTLFLIGFSKEQDRVVRAWCAPTVLLPKRAKVMSPDSREYVPGWEVPDVDIAILNKYLQVHLAKALDPDVQAPVVVPRHDASPYARQALGRLGEQFYQRLFPTSDYVAGRDALAPYDFIDPDGITVNVRVRRRGLDGRWTFFRHPGSVVQEYFFIGVDPLAQTVEVLFRTKTENLPEHGFSYRPGVPSKWEPYSYPLPCPLLDGSQESLDSLRLGFSGLTAQRVAMLKDTEKDALLRSAFQYHRQLGFPYPDKPSDKMLMGDVSRLRAVGMGGTELPSEKAGLGFCAACMPHRYKSRNIHATFSAYDAFYDDRRLQRALAFSFSGAQPSLERSALRSALTALNRTPGQFSPAVAKVLVERYCPTGGLVLDPCAGWGGRLMGTLVAGRCYLGVDSYKETADGLYQIGSRLCECLALDRGVFQVLGEKIEDLEDSFCRAGFALTSPPYWNQEIYEAEDTRSLSVWISEFLSPLFHKVATCLPSGAKFAVNIADVKRGTKTVPLVGLCKEMAAKEGFVLSETLWLPKGTFGKDSSGKEPILIFKKI
jgi:hypothetical protein